MMYASDWKPALESWYLYSSLANFWRSWISHSPMSSSVCAKSASSHWNNGSNSGCCKKYRFWSFNTLFQIWTKEAFYIIKLQIFVHLCECRYLFLYICSQQLAILSKWSLFINKSNFWWLQWKKMICSLNRLTFYCIKGNRWQTEWEAKFTWIMSRCEGGRQQPTDWHWHTLSKCRSYIHYALHPEKRGWGVNRECP